jgi:hypothetical protein
MKGHLGLLALIVLLLSSGCFGGGGDFNGDPEAVRKAKQSAEQIALDVTAENLVHATSYIHDDFVLDPAVAQKFDVGEFEGQGPDAFEEFFQRVIDKYGDIGLLITFNWFEIQNNQVLLHAHVEFDGDNGNSVPHQELSFEEDDLLTFEWNGTVYALLGWEEDPNPNPPPPHNEGGGNTF